MLKPLKINELKESDLPSTFKLKKELKNSLFMKYKELNIFLNELGYYSMPFPDFVHLLLEKGLDKFDPKEYLKNTIEIDLKHRDEEKD